MPPEPVPPTVSPAGGKKLVTTPVQFFLRGLAISLPTILTVMIVLWILGGINTYIVYPATSAVKWVLAQALDESIPAKTLVALPAGPELEGAGRNYRVTPQTRETYLALAARQPAIADSDWLASQPGVYVPFQDRAVPFEQFLVVHRELHPPDPPRTATEFYMDYAVVRAFGRLFNLSLLAILLIVILLYFIGRFVSVRVGLWLVSRFETGVLGRLPLIRNVYGSVKQVTDFLFSESQVEYRRVVAIEYPRRGSWTLGLVTGDGLLGITAAIGEPCVTVLVPTSPMPMGGFTICVPRSHVLDLDLSVDQAMQFCISCGVLVPPQQRVTPELLREHLEKRFSEGFKSSGTSRKRGALEDSTPGGNGQGGGSEVTPFPGSGSEPAPRETP